MYKHSIIFSAICVRLLYDIVWQNPASDAYLLIVPCYKYLRHKIPEGVAISNTVEQFV